MPRIGWFEVAAVAGLTDAAAIRTASRPGPRGSTSTSRRPGLAPLIAFASLVAVPGAASAGVYSGDHFRMIGYGPESHVALWVDTTRIERHGSLVSAWLLMVGADDVDSETGKAATAADYKMIRAGYDCAASTYRFSEGAYYSYGGQRLRDYAADQTWRPVADRSLAGAAERYLCHGAAIQIDMTSDNLSEALSFSLHRRRGSVGD